MFGAVVRWVKEDEGARGGALDRLLPLVQLAVGETGIMHPALPFSIGIEWRCLQNDSLTDG